MSVGSTVLKRAAMLLGIPAEELRARLAPQSPSLTVDVADCRACPLRQARRCSVKAYTIVDLPNQPAPTWCPLRESRIDVRAGFKP